MSEATQLRKLMESMQPAECSCNQRTVYEGEWYPILQRINKAIEQHGLSPETIQDAANEAADFYYEDMGYDTPDDAQQRIVQAWMDMTEKGQQLRKLLAPRESIGEDGNYKVAADRKTVKLMYHGKVVVSISQDDFEDIIGQYNKEMEKYQLST